MKDTATADNDLAGRLEALSVGATGVTVHSFEGLFKNMPEEMSVAQLNQIINFASDQVGIWEAAYSFSSAYSPNAAAKAESERWEQLWGAWLDMFLKLIPDVAEQAHRRHRLIVLQHSIEKGLHYTDNRPLRRMFIGAVSKVAIGLAKIGISDLSKRLYAFSLYPKGSVGRGKL